MSSVEKRGRPRTGRDDGTARINKNVLGRARYVATARGLTVAEYLTRVLGPVVDRDFYAESDRVKPSES